MLDDHLSFAFEFGDKTLRGFCMRINDEFYETYAVIVDGYQSFSIWLDQSKSKWNVSKYANIDAEALKKIINFLPPSLQELC